MSCNLQHTASIYLVTLVTIYYYACPIRSNPIIIICDALIVSTVLHTFSLFVISPGTSFLEVVAGCGNHTMHCLNGNTNQTTPPIILSLSLDSLLPVDTITPNHHNDLPVFKLSRNFLLEQGPPKIVHPPTELGNNFPLLMPRPSFRKGVRGSRYNSGNNVKHWYRRKKLNILKDSRPLRCPLNSQQSVTLTPPPGGTPGVASATIARLPPHLFLCFR